jgi:hypothetical protein
MPEQIENALIKITRDFI